MMRRSINVLKMRGSAHDAAFREFTIDGEGMHIGDPFRNVSGILTGNPHLVSVGNGADNGDQDD
jgi:circadian clock protein KaiC